MLKELRGTEEISQFFDELREKPNGKFNQARIYGMAYRMQEINQLENSIEEGVKSGTLNRVEKVTIIDDSMSIIETSYHQERIFFVYVNGRHHHEGTDSFDKALALALSVKYGFPQLHVAISNMLQMEKKEGK